VIPILTNAFLEQMRNILKNLVSAKSFVCDERFSQKLGTRQKRGVRAKSLKVDFFDAINFTPSTF